MTVKMKTEEKILNRLRPNGQSTAAALAVSIREPRLRVYRCLSQMVAAKAVKVVAHATATRSRGPKPRIYGIP